MDKITEYSMKNYNKIAKNYDNTFDGSYTKRFKDELVNTVQLKDSYVVLDVACGNGTLLKMLSEKAKIQAYGVDISENMIKEAKSRNPEMNFMAADSAALPFSDGFFDLVTVCAAFHHFTKPDQFIKEVKRILKTGGRIYIADPYFPPLVRQIANLIFPLFKSGDVKVYNKKELKNFLYTHGFTDVEVNRFDMRGYLLTGKK